MKQIDLEEARRLFAERRLELEELTLGNTEEAVTARLELAALEAISVWRMTEINRRTDGAYIIGSIITLFESVLASEILARVPPDRQPRVVQSIAMQIRNDMMAVCLTPKEERAAFASELVAKEVPLS